MPAFFRVVYGLALQAHSRSSMVVQFLTKQRLVFGKVALPNLKFLSSTKTHLTSSLHPTCSVMAQAANVSAEPEQPERPMGTALSGPNEKANAKHARGYDILLKRPDQGKYDINGYPKERKRGAQFAEYVIKTNDKGEREPCIILLTDRALYILHSDRQVGDCHTMHDDFTDVNRQLYLADIEWIVIPKAYDKTMDPSQRPREFIIHIPGDGDLRLETVKTKDKKRSAKGLAWDIIWSICKIRKSKKSPFELVEVKTLEQLNKKTMKDAYTPKYKPYTIKKLGHKKKGKKDKKDEND